MNKRKVELKPCPFCGGPGKIYYYADTREWWGYCDNDECQCQPFLKVSKSRREAVEAWNRRAKEVKR